MLVSSKKPIFRAGVQSVERRGELRNRCYFSLWNAGGRLCSSLPPPAPPPTLGHAAFTRPPRQKTAQFCISRSAGGPPFLAPRSTRHGAFCGAVARGTRRGEPIVPTPHDKTHSKGQKSSPNVGRGGTTHCRGGCQSSSELLTNVGYDRGSPERFCSLTMGAHTPPQVPCHPWPAPSRTWATNFWR